LATQQLRHCDHRATFKNQAAQWSLVLKICTTGLYVALRPLRRRCALAQWSASLADKKSTNSNYFGDFERSHCLWDGHARGGGGGPGLTHSESPETARRARESPLSFLEVMSD
jgi:hypothetical protein